MTDSNNTKKSFTILYKEFKEIIGFEPIFDKDYSQEYKKILDYFSSKKLLLNKKRRQLFIGQINKKFETNKKAISNVFTSLANLGYSLNFHEKNNIKNAFNLSDIDIFIKTLKHSSVNEEDIHSLCKLFKPVSEADTIKFVKNEISSPSKLKTKEKREGIKEDILKSLYSSFLWSAVPTKNMHTYFNHNFSVPKYQKSFWKQLQTKCPSLFNRNNALHIINLNKEATSKLLDLKTRSATLTALMRKQFDLINNYGYLAFIIDSSKYKNRVNEWELASDIMLIGEKFDEKKLNKNFFNWEKIQNITINHIKKIELDKAGFDLANEGFTYKDTFVISRKSTKIEKILLIFQKNYRDDTPIPCPSCRSEKVRGNSYSSLGVRSWECVNPLCPDRSKYNRGKRFSFKSLLAQEAIEDKNKIPLESVKTWRKDVLKNINNNDIFDMLIRHYSIKEDGVHLYNLDIKNTKPLGRQIFWHQLFLEDDKNIPFYENHFTKRYGITVDKKSIIPENIGDKNFKVFVGDAANILRSIPGNSFDGAITSPPYYNAREYSQWPNIYCYLQDMFDINKQVYRTLKPGSIYLYNIFDYFDNENTIAFSAMGQKRMIISAYTIDLFRKIGFRILGNIVWNKGDIEGKRGFNSGNFSPFYQSPFNCWEHIIIFQKPVNKKNTNQIELLNNTILNCKPVIKMIKGKNLHGHTAPFPDELPEILISILKKGSVVLDPFAGSLTSARVAEKYGLKSVSIEQSMKYCKLGLKMRKI